MLGTADSAPRPQVKLMSRLPYLSHTQLWELRKTFRRCLDAIESQMAVNDKIWDGVASPLLESVDSNAVQPPPPASVNRNKRKRYKPERRERLEIPEGIDEAHAIEIDGN